RAWSSAMRGMVGSAPHAPSARVVCRRQPTGRAGRRVQQPTDAAVYAVGASDAAQYRDDDAQHNGPVAVDDVVIRVSRLERDVAAAAAVHLDGGLVIDHRGDDLA